MKNPFEYSRRKALEKGNAKVYFALCTHLCVKPENEILYRKGLEIVEYLRNRTIETKIKENLG